MKVTLNLPDIDGFEYTGERRRVNSDEWYLDNDNKAAYSENGYLCVPVLILKKKAPEYKIITAASFLQESGHIDLRKKYVEIKALEDALKIIDSHYNWAEENKARTEILRGLTK